MSGDVEMTAPDGAAIPPPDGESPDPTPHAKSVHPTPDAESVDPTPDSESVDPTQVGESADPPPKAESVEPARDGARRPRSPRRRRRVRVLLVLLGVLLLAAAWLAVRGYQAVTALRDAQHTLTALADEAGSGQVAQLASGLPGVQADLHRARSAVQDPVWRAAVVLPWLGDQLSAVRTVTVALADMVDAAGPALTALDSALAAQDAPGTNGRLVLSPLVDAAPTIIAAKDVVDRAASQIAAVDTTKLLPQLAAGIEKVQVELPRVTSAVDVGARAAALLPGMLGADGPRTYLLVSLNSAELRAAGGIVGAFAVLRADGGALDLIAQRTTASFPGLAEPVLPLTPTEELLQTDRLGRWVQNAVQTPDFPRAAQLLVARWEQDTGQQVDGVIATDPVAVAALLRATGPVTEPSGITLTADNLVSILLHETYLRLTDPADADGFYTDVAATVFSAVGHGQGDRLQVVEALAKDIAAGRVRVWSERPDEQSQLAATPLGGAFLSGPFGDAAGVFLDDGTAGKLDYYLKTTVTVEGLDCTAAEPTATVRLDLAYDPPPDVASQPRYVTGYSVAPLPTGWLATNISVYSPVGADLAALGLDDGYVSGVTAQSAGRSVQVVTSWLAPGGRATYRAVVPVRGGTLSVWSTPTLTSDGLMSVTCPAG